MRSRTSIALVGACAVLLAACGGVPSSSEPMRAASVDADGRQPHVTGTRPGPQEDASPTEIIEGFIAAMEFYESPGGYPTAKEYLTQEAAAQWDNPLSEILIYNGDPVVEVDENVATLTVAVEATFDRTDGFVRHPSSEEASLTFDLESVAGQWRLASAPAGLLIESSAFDNDFEASNLYFHNKSFDALVPDEIYLPRTAGNLETLLVKALLAGPSGWLAPAVETAFPEGTALSPESVPVNSGDARVTLGEAALEYEDDTVTSPETREHMVEQLVRTLGEQRTVDRVSVTVTGEGQTVLSGTEETPYVAAEQSQSPGLARRLYAVTEGGVAWLVEDSTPAELTPVTGPLGNYPGLQEVAIAHDRRTVAAVNENDELVLAELSTGNEVTDLYPAGGAFGSLAWDSSGLLWAIERERAPENDEGGPGDGADGDVQSDDEQSEKKAEGDSGNRLLVIDPETGDVAPMTPPTPGDAEIEQMAIAPDGTRIAFVIDGRLFEAIVVRHPDRPVDLDAIEVRGMRELHVEGISDPVADVDWHGGGELAVLTAPEASDSEGIEPGSSGVSGAVDPRAYVVTLSELDVTDSRPVDAGVSVAAASVGHRLAVGTSDDMVWIRSATGRWVLLDGATSPAFSG